MNKNDKSYKDCLQILKEELLPAMGCTEPIAISYCAAVAREELGKMPEKVEITASGNIIKNVKSVVVPNTDGLKGIPTAAAAGIVAGKADKKLEVISEVSAEQKAEIKKFLETVPIEVKASEAPLVFDIIVTLRAGNDYATVRIINNHTNIVTIEKNGKVLKSEPIVDSSDDGLTDRSFLSVELIYDFAESVDIADVDELITTQIDYNMAIAEEGIKNSYGANIGSVLLHNRDDIRTRARAMAAAGSDARMSGCELPVVINSGSGNQGITASVPVIVYAKDMGVTREKMYRALVLSNLLGIHQKTGIGRLSAYCGAISAGAAAGAAIAYLKDGSLRAISHTLVNALSIVSGIICDGAKPSCAGKIAEAVDAGILGYEMYVDGQQIYGGDGITKKGVENMIKGVGRLGREGMKQTDKVILDIMLSE